MSEGFAVTPKNDCPHCLDLDTQHLTNDSSIFTSGCQDCSDFRENWLCLDCKTIACSSYVNKHMSAHSTLSSHQTVLSLIDLSAWCYACESYITSPLIENIVRVLGDFKHNVEVRPLDSDLSDIRISDLQKELEAAKNAKQVGGMYAISPKDDCPHVITEHITEDLSIFEDIRVDSSCTDCSNTQENWVCLKCGIVKCSRYVQEHMLFHALETTHPIALSFSDLSFWCYACESYIVDHDLAEIYKIFAGKKFGPAGPNVYNSTAHITEEEKKEYFDTEEELETKIEILADWVRNSRCCIAFTGAGISTSAGIPDYRSGFNTVLPTGAGCWERKAAGKVGKEKPKLRTAIEKALPTYTHMALFELMNRGLMKYLLSQNVDGLHRKSGIPVERLAELHGNANVEKCKVCKKEYMRDYGVRNNLNVHMHETGSFCDDPVCRGSLVDTIINFGENLDPDVLSKCYLASEEADLCIAMGSSLRVNPAALFPKAVSTHGKLVVVNLQKTPLDKHALKINALCDTVMIKLAEKLGIEVQQFKLRRRIAIGKQGENYLVRGIDFNGDPYSILTKVDFQGLVVESEPFMLDCQRSFSWIELHFQGHYGETPLKLQIESWDVKEEEKIFDIVYDPYTGNWL